MLSLGDKCVSVQPLHLEHTYICHTHAHACTHKHNAILGFKSFQLSPRGDVGEWEAGTGPGKTGHRSCLAILLAKEKGEEGCRVTADG